MTTIEIQKIANSFAENKDAARAIRIDKIIPAIASGEEVVLDFEGVSATTQSFIHALISDVVRKFGGDALDKMYFKNCNKTVQSIINIVVSYVQEAE
jgi:L-lactate permease